MNHNDYLDANLKVFPLWGKTAAGHCACGDHDCETVLKHPRISNWQHTPHWSDEQIEVMEAVGQFDTGFGVLVDGIFVIDIDPRNGGDESYTRLCADTGVDYEAVSGFVVRTGGGGRHIYFAMPDKLALCQHLDQYKGIDFKSSGYVVGAGSLHASGAEYEAIKGYPDEITAGIPDPLVQLLKKPERRRVSIGQNETMDVSEQEIADMLSYIDPDCDYDTWSNCGMAVHDATGGNDFHIWNDWSKGGSKYPGEPKLDRHWQSFGKCANPITLGTLIYHAEQAGWTMPVTFDLPEGYQAPVPVHGADGEDWDEEFDPLGHPVPVDGIDIRRPPGFVGTLTDWINGNSIKPRENLAPLAALTAVSSICAMRYQDDRTGVTPNIMSLMVAGSGTGKNAIEESFVDIINAAGMGRAMHGTIKSDTEIIRNFIRNQLSIYQLGEVGIFLSKVINGSKSTPYLAGVIGNVMDIYSKANGTYTLGGDVKEEAKGKMLSEIARLRRQVNENESKRPEQDTAEADALEAAVLQIDQGLINPCLTMLGATTPETFDAMVSYEQVANGFFARTIIGREANSAPRRKRGFRGKQTLPDMVKARLASLSNPGCSEPPEGRLQHIGPRVKIPTEPDAADELTRIEDWAEDLSIYHDKHTGLAAIPNRCAEMISKVSLVLAIPEGVRTVEHVRYAYKLIRRDAETKIEMARISMLEDSKLQQDVVDTLEAKILQKCRDDDGMPVSQIVRAVGRKYQRQDIETMIGVLAESGKLERIESAGKPGRPSIRYRTTE